MTTQIGNLHTNLNVNESIIDEICCITIHPKGITCNLSNHVNAIEFATASNLVGTTIH